TSSSFSGCTAGNHAGVGRALLEREHEFGTLAAAAREAAGSSGACGSQARSTMEYRLLANGRWREAAAVWQARRAVDRGADVIIGEAGGNGGFVSTMVMVPAVIYLAGAVSVVAAGGIADGRGLAAA